MNRFRLLLSMSLFVVLFGSNAAHAERNRGPVSVSINCTCDDVMGKQYVSAVRSLLAENAHYQQASAGTSSENSIRIHIISMAIPSPDGKPRSVLSIVCLHNGVMVHQFVETCTGVPIRDCAQSMVDGLKDLDS
jgi:hypothetical protein